MESHGHPSPPGTPAAQPVSPAIGTLAPLPFYTGLVQMFSTGPKSRGARGCHAWKPAPRAIRALRTVGGGDGFVTAKQRSAAVSLPSAHPPIQRPSIPNRLRGLRPQRLVQDCSEQRCSRQPRLDTAQTSIMLGTERRREALAAGIRPQECRARVLPSSGFCWNCTTVRDPSSAQAWISRRLPPSRAPSVISVPGLLPLGLGGKGNRHVVTSWQ